MKLLTGGKYDEELGLFNCPGDEFHQKYYIASDSVHSDNFHNIIPIDLIEIMQKWEYSYNLITKTGAVFHLLGCLSENGKVGITAIGNSPNEATTIFEGTKSYLIEEAGKVIQESI